MARLFLVAREGVFAGVFAAVVAIAVVSPVTVAVASATSASGDALVPGVRVRVLLLALRGGVLDFIILDMFEGLYCMKNIV
jgi:hypothetical protein